MDPSEAILEKLAFESYILLYQTDNEISKAETRYCRIEDLNDLAIRYIKMSGASFHDELKKFLGMPTACFYGTININCDPATESYWTGVLCRKNGKNVDLEFYCSFQNHLIESAINNKFPEFQFQFVNKTNNTSGESSIDGSINAAFKRLGFDKEYDFDKLVVENSVKITLRVKQSLARVIKSFQSIMEREIDYKISESSLGTFLSYLEKKSFQHKCSDILDLPYEIVLLTKKLKDRNTIIVDPSNILEKYLLKNRNKFSEDINEFADLLKSQEFHPQKHNVALKDCLSVAISKRIEFLLIFTEFAGKYLEDNDFESIFVICEDFNFEIRRLELDKDDALVKLNALDAEIRSIKSNLNLAAILEQVDKINFKYEEAKIWDGKIDEIKRALRCKQQKQEVMKSSDFHKVLKLMMENDVKVRKPDIFERIVNLSKGSLGSEISAAILRLITLSEDIDATKIPDEIFMYLGQEHIWEVLKVGRKLKGCDHFFKYLSLVLLKNENEQARSQVLQLIGEFDLPDDVKKILDLEQNIKINSHNALDICVEYVTKYNVPLTVSCFEVILKDFTDKRVYSLLKYIIDNNIQELPELFINSFKYSLKKVKITPVIMKLIDLFLMSQYLLLDDIHDVLGILLECGYLTDECLEVILAAHKIGQEVSNELLLKIKKVSSKKADMILRLITRKIDIELDTLLDPRIRLCERFSALEEIAHNPKHHNNFTVEMLQILMEFEPDFGEYIIEALEKILPNNFSQFFYIDIVGIVGKMINGKIIVTSSVLGNMAKIIRKDPSFPREHFVDLLIHLIYSNHLRAEAIEFLVDLGKVEQDIELFTEKRKDIVIILKYFADSNDKCKIVNALLVIYPSLRIDFTLTLDEMIKSLKQGKFFSEEALSYLISQVDFDKLYIVWDTFLHQGFSANHFELLFEKFRCNPKIIEDAIALQLILEGCKLINISSELLDIICNNLLYSYNYFQFILIGKFILPEDKLIKMSNFLKLNHKKLPSQIKELIIKIFSRHSLPDAVVEILQFITLCNNENFYFVKLCFEVIGKNSTNSRGYLKKYCETVLHSFWPNTRLFLIMKDFVYNHDYLSDIHTLLLSLTNLRIFGITPEEIEAVMENDPKNCFIELLCLELLCRTSQLGFDDLNTCSFLEKLRGLKLNIPEKKHILQNLIGKQMLHDLNMKDINELLDMGCISFDLDLKEMRKKFISNQLQEIGIKHSNYDLMEFYKILPYDALVLSTVFAKLKVADLRSLKRFFKLLYGINLSEEEKIKLLLDLNSPVLDNWFDELCERIIGVIFSKYNISIHCEFRKKMTQILSIGWRLESICIIVEKCQSMTSSQLDKFITSLDPIHEYKLREYEISFSGDMLLNILLKEDKLDRLPSLVHELAIFKIFPGTYNKDSNELGQELIALNEGTSSSYLNLKNHMQDYNEFLKFYTDGVSSVLPQRGSISTWSKCDLQKWVSGFRTESFNISIIEKVCIAYRGIEICKNYPPRPVQIYSLFCLLRNDGKGRLSQINTGEGKTTIVAMFSVLKALEGKCVDVITSSPELARPQSEELEKFYDLFNLRVEHNGHSSRKDIKDRYKANIVYGAAADFQGDILRDEYSKLGTLNGRNNEVAVVDEVDSMLLDGKNHIVMLSTAMPAMNNLEVILATIYIQIELVASCLVEKDGNIYYLEKPESLNSSGKLKDSILEQAHLIECSKHDFIRKCTETHLRKMLRDANAVSEEEAKSLPHLKVPSHLKEFVLNVQLKEWIDRAICARFYYENGKHYILRDGKIAPVDAANTGVVQSKMQWNCGLHQFLQVKHGTKITPESLTTNYISNVSYFRRYGNEIFGLTGTLGSKYARQLLEETYNVDSMIVPPFRLKRHFQLKPIICADEKDWYSCIVRTCINKLQNNRGVLIISKYIEETENILNAFKLLNYPQSKLKIYKTEADSKVVQDELKEGEVIIATNIAGRGTDIKTSPRIEENGGLHVCITFLPANERIEEQNVGRTSRTGNKGTSQFIILSKECSFLILKTNRNLQEESNLKKSRIEIRKVICKDEIFHKFCKLLDGVLENKIENMDIIKRAIEDRFGIWLQMQKDLLESNDNQTLFKNFDKFKIEIMRDIELTKVIKNAYFYVLIGNRYLDNQNYILAIYNYKKAIDLDADFSEYSYYGRGIAKIAEYGKNINSNINQIKSAVEDFKNARKIICYRECELQIIQRASSGAVYSEQVAHKLTIYSMQKNIIEYAIGLDREATEIELKRLSDTKQALLKRNEEGDNEKIRKIDETIADLKEQIKVRGNGGIIGQALRDKHDLKIEITGLKKCLPESEDAQLYKDEIDEFKMNGYIGAFEVSIIKPIDWKAVICLLLLGLAQLIAGAAIAVFTLGTGTSIGMGLMSEGISDLITAVKDGIINRDFSWVSWGIQKAISLTVSIVCAGLSAIKDVAKTTVAGVKQVGKIVMDQSIKQGWKIAAKAIGTSLAKGIAKELVSTLVDHGIDQMLVPIIEKKVFEMVEGPIQNALLNNETVKKMLELDQFVRNRKYENLLRSKAFEILAQSNKSELFNTIIIGITRGIATNKIKGLSAALQANELTTNLAKISTYVFHYINSLEKIINDLENTQKISETYEKSVTKFGEQANTNNVTQDVILNSESVDIYDDVDISKLLRKEVQANITQNSKTPYDLSKEVVSKVSNHMTNMIKGKILSPLVNMGVGYTMDSLTADLDKALTNNIENYKSERRIEFFQNGDKTNRIPSKFKKGIEDKSSVKKAEQMIDDIKNGGEAGLQHLGSLSDSINSPIEIYDEHGSLVRIIGADKSGKPVKAQYCKNRGDGKGHWTHIGNKEPIKTTGNNNCLFDVVAEQIGEDGNTLREKTAISMSNNIEILANQARDVIRLEIYNKVALTLGGAEYYGTCPDDAKRLTRESQNTIGFQHPTKAHPEGHINDPNKPFAGSNAKDKIKNVQRYSEKSKTGKCSFTDPEQQAEICHLALSHPKAKEARRRLNDMAEKYKTLNTEEKKNFNYDFREVLNLKLVEIGVNKPQYMETWIEGKLSKTDLMDGVTLVLQHHNGKQFDRNADVQLFTMYPEHANDIENNK